jgi:flavin-dependent dehydrogenase
VFKNVAAWSYWTGVKKAPKGPDGAIAVCSIPSGWFWVIPLHDGTTSVGLVTGRDHFNARRAELGSVEAVYEDGMRECPAVLDLLADAKQVAGMRVEQDYSYTTDQLAGPGYVMSGDSAFFLDPLLSTGVHLATYSAMLGAASIGSITRGETTEDEALEFYRTVYRHSYERLLVLVSVFYESYRGKDYHFYNAQRLSQTERDDLNLQAAFDRIITGIEDLNDAQQAYARVQAHPTGNTSCARRRSTRTTQSAASTW